MWVSFSADGKRVVSASENCVKIWDAATGAEVISFERALCKYEYR